MWKVLLILYHFTGNNLSAFRTFIISTNSPTFYPLLNISDEIYGHNIEIDLDNVVFVFIHLVQSMASAGHNRRALCQATLPDSMHV